MATTTFTAAPGTDPALVVTDAMIRIDHELTHLPTKTALQLINFSRNRLDATEARLLADRYENGASDRQVEDLVRNQGNTSKKEAKKRASRAKATNANPDIATKLETGELTTEQADVIADAAEETDGAAACDPELIEQVSKTTPEQGRKKARKYVNDRQNADDIQNRHDKQHRQRGWYRHRLPNGNSAITFHGTDEKIDDIERKVTTGADQEYQADGGRNVPRHKHPRTNDQRGFDAAHKLITGTGTENNNSCNNSRDADQDAGNANNSDADQGDHASQAGHTDEANSSKSSNKPPARPQRRTVRDVVHVNVTLEQLTGTDRSAIIASDGKPLPRSIFDELVCGADFIAHIFDGNGDLLWQGRRKRLATPAQINGLIARDGQCVQCGAHHTKCVAHHLLPSIAPAQGETNINNLAFVCDDCHIRIHQQNLTLYYDPGNQTWKTRAAKPHEIPPDNQHQKPKPTVGKYRNKPSPAPNRQHPEHGKPRAHEQRNNFHRKLF